MNTQASISRKVLTFLAICAFGVSMTAQITIDSGDVPQIGDVFNNYLDDSPDSTITPGPSGADQVWDFSSLMALDSVKQAAIDPANAFGGDEFPEATFALTTEGSINTQFAKVNPTEVEGIGIVLSNPLTGGAEVVGLSPTQTVATLPTNYDDNYVDEFGFTLGLPPLVPQVDSIRVLNTTTTWRHIDAWGTMTLPEGDYEVLRSRDSTSSITVVEGLLGFFWIPVQQDTQLTFTYNFLAKESKGILAAMNMSFDGETVQNVTWVDLSDEVIDVPVADFSFVPLGDPSLREFEFTDLSINAPDSWIWDFDDGNGSQLQNPVHQYEENGSYNVCLTAGNLGGVHSVCKTVVVDVQDPPVADFSYTSDGFNNFEFMDESQNDPASWLWTFGDGQTSTQQNPNHEYAISDVYEVCLEVTNSAGMDQSCQMITANVQLAPLASFSWTTDNLNVMFIDLSSNVPTQWLWDFDDGNTSILQNPEHMFAATGGIFNVCLTASNSLGSDTNCQNVEIIGSATQTLWPENWTILPNPASQSLRIELDASANGAQLFFSNALGQDIKQMTYTGSETIDIDDWTEGVYFLRIVQDSKLLGTHQLIKQ